MYFFTLQSEAFYRNKMTKKLKGKFSIRYIILGISNALAFHFVGLIIIAETLICILSIYEIVRIPKYANRKEQIMIKMILFLGVIWFVTQLFTDLYRQSTRSDMLKSLSQIFVFTLLVLAMLIHFQRKMNALRDYLIGVCFSTFIIFIDASASGTAGDWWKFYFGPALSILALMYIGNLKSKTQVKFSLVVGLSFISILLGSRSLGLILLLTAIGFLNFASSRGVGKSLVYLVILVILGNFLNNLVRDASLSGQLGLAQQLKAQQQYQSGPILLVARSELLYEISSIKVSPFFGLGSSPAPSAKVLVNTYDLETRFGINTKQTAAYADLIRTGRTPQHSVFFGAWVEGGLLSVLLLAYLFLMMLKWNARNNIRTSTSKYSVLSRYFFFNFVWAFFFSPLGAGSRMTLAIGFGVCFFAFRDNQIRETTNDL